MDQSASAPAWPHRALLILLLAASSWTALTFAAHAFANPGASMRMAAIGLIAVSGIALYGIWQRRPWACWSALAAACAILTVDLYGWSAGLGTLWPLATAAMAIGAIAAAFRIGETARAVLAPRQRLFFAIIVAFPAWVAAGGLFMPGQIDLFLPFKVPPLHARFIGAMYIAGATMMLLAAMATAWSTVRVATVILGTWTGLLGIVSLIHLPVFDWSWRPTWFWWFAYIWFPVGAAFLVWNQRNETRHPTEPAVSPCLRRCLVVLGTVAVVLAVGLLAMPHLMIAVWPWSITPLLTQIYSAPFLAYGIGALYASRQDGWSEMRIPVIAILVFTATAFAVSLLHTGLFDPTSGSTWAWFGGLGLTALTLAAFATIRSLRGTLPI